MESYGFHFSFHILWNLQFVLLQGCGITGFLPTSVIGLGIPPSMKKIVVGKPFLLHHTSGFHSPSAKNSSPFMSLHFGTRSFCFPLTRPNKNHKNMFCLFSPNQANAELRSDALPVEPGWFREDGFWSRDQFVFVGSMLVKRCSRLAVGTHVTFLLLVV